MEYFSGKFGEIGQKSFAHPKIFLLYTYGMRHGYQKFHNDSSTYRYVARNFDRGANNNEVSTFKYIMPLVFKASSTKGAFFWRFYSEYLCSNLQREVNLH